MNLYSILYLIFLLFQTTKTRLTSDSGQPVELHAGREVKERLRHFRQGRSDLQEKRAGIGASLAEQPLEFSR